MAEEVKRTALVTGGNRGIGFAAAKLLARQGLSVIIGGRQQAAVVTAARDLEEEGLPVVGVELDVNSKEDAGKVRRFIDDHYGGLDVLINNAGVLLDKGWGEREGSPSLLDAEIETIRASMETNLYGPIRLCQTFVPQMRERGYGRIVNVSSGMGQLSEMEGGYPGYRLSKTALNALTRMLAAELVDEDVKINSLCPGWVRTRMGGADATRSPEEAAETIAWLATLPADGPSGGFFRDKEPLPW